MGQSILSSLISPQATALSEIPISFGANSMLSSWHHCSWKYWHVSWGKILEWTAVLSHSIRSLFLLFRYGLASTTTYDQSSQDHILPKLRTRYQLHAKWAWGPKLPCVSLVIMHNARDTDLDNLPPYFLNVTNKPSPNWNWRAEGHPDRTLHFTEASNPSTPNKNVLMHAGGKENFHLQV